MTFNTIIVDFGLNSQQVDKFRQSLAAKGENVGYVRVDSHTLHANPNKSELDIFNNADINTRVYVMAHGKPYCPTVTGSDDPNKPDDRFYCHYTDMSNYLQQRVSSEFKNQVAKDGQTLNLNLISCYAGVGEDSSFASLLHRDLAQRCQIKASIVARNEFVTFFGTGQKLTRSVLARKWDQYTDAPRLNRDKWIEDRHKNAGSKSEWYWNENGNQVTIDAYIKKFTETASQAALSLSKQVTAQDPPEIKSTLNDILAKCKKPENLQKDDVDHIVKNLTKIEDQLNALHSKSKTHMKSVQQCNDLASRSISSWSSVKPKSFTHKMRDRVNIESPIDIKTKIIDKTLNKNIDLMLKHSKDTQAKAQFKNSYQAFSKHLAEGIDHRVRTGFDINVEQEIVNSVVDLMLVINSQKFSKEEKTKEINKFFESAMKTIDNNIFSPSMQGYVEGVQKALSYGGMAFYDPLKILPEQYAEWQTEYTDNTKILLQDFKEKLIKHLDQSNYLGYKTIDDEIISDASKLLKEKMNVINETIHKSILIMKELNALDEEVGIELILKYNIQIEENENLIKENTKYVASMAKLCQLNGLNPQPKNFYQHEVLPIIERKCQELANVNAEVEKAFKSRQKLFSK